MKTPVLLYLYIPTIVSSRYCPGAEMLQNREGTCEKNLLLLFLSIEAEETPTVHNDLPGEERRSSL